VKLTEQLVSIPPVLRSYVFWSIILTVAAFGTKSFCLRVLHLPEAYLFTVTPQSFRFIDFRCFQPRFRDFHHLTFFANDSWHSMPFTYPAPAALVFQFFYRLPRATLSFIVTASAFVLFAAVKFRTTLVRCGLSGDDASAFVIVCLFCSWPLFVAYWVANIEIVVGILVGWGLYLFITERSWRAATLISIAAAIKIFPFVFLALFLGKRQYKQMAFIIGLAATIDVVALRMISGSIPVSAAGISAGLKYLEYVYVLPYNWIGTGADHSLFALLKSALVVSIHPYPAFGTMVALVRGYTVLMAVADLSLYFLCIRFLPLLNQILCLCILAILTTPLSVDYTLMHLYVPWGMMVLLAIEAWRDGREIPGMKAAFFCFLILMCSLSEFMFHHCIFGGQIKAIALTVLLVIGLRYRFVAGEQPSSYAPA
jgi:hypothetical protein